MPTGQVLDKSNFQPILISEEVEMFKHYGWKWKTIIILAIFILLSISAIRIKTKVKRQGRPTPPGLPNLVPATSRLHATTTPQNPPFDTEIYLMTASHYPTTTPFIISKYTDLSPSIDDQDKFHINVSHMDGTNEQFAVGPLRSPSDLDNGLPSYILADIHLLPGDEIKGWLPPVPYQRYPPGALETMAALRTPSTTIYPTPIPFNPALYPSSTEIPINPTPRTYP